MSASRRYKVRPYRIKTQEVADLCGGSTLAEFYSMADSSTTVRGIPIPIAGGCWAGCQLHAGVRYVPYRMKTQEVADLSGGSTLAEFYLMADSSTTVTGIPILIVGGCWAGCQLHAGIRYVSVTSKPRISRATVEGGRR